MLGCGVCGCFDSCKLCTYTVCSKYCCEFCRDRKREIRLNRWLKAEMLECEEWDYGLSGKEQYAELVIGTNELAHVGPELAHRKRFIRELKKEYVIERAEVLSPQLSVESLKSEKQTVVSPSE